MQPTVRASMWLVSSQKKSLPKSQDCFPYHACFDHAADFFTSQVYPNSSFLALHSRVWRADQGSAYLTNSNSISRKKGRSMIDREPLRSARAHSSFALRLQVAQAVLPEFPVKTSSSRYFGFPQRSRIMMLRLRCRRDSWVRYSSRFPRVYKRLPSSKGSISASIPLLTAAAVVFRRLQMV